MTFSYIRDIPDGPNNPSNDQPNMKINTNAIDDLIAVDHVSFNVVSGGGEHKQVAFNGKNAAGVQADPKSTLFTASGTASSVASLRYRNQSVSFVINEIRAFAFCSGLAGGIISSQSNNVTSVVRNSIGNYTVTLVANATTTANYGILASCTLSTVGGGNPMAINYQITSATTFNLLTYDLFTNDLRDSTSFSFSVFQI